MIKKILLGLGLSVLSFIGFSIAGEIRQIGIYGFSPYDNGYDINVLPKGTFLTQQVGYTKNLLYLSSRSYWFWSYDSSVGFNNLYNYMDGYNGGTNQGFVNSYVICPYAFTGVDSNFSLSSCSEYSVTNDSYNIFKNFLSTVKSSDYYYLDFEESSWASSTTNRLCFSSSELGKLLCFGNCRTSYPQGATCKSLTTETNYGNTHGSMGFGSGFASVSVSYLQNSPGISNNSFESGSGSFDSTGDTLNVDSDVDTIINFFESRYGFNENLCWVGSDNFSIPYGSGNVCDSSTSLPSGNSNFDIVCNHIDGTDYDYSCSPMLTYINGSCDLQFSLTSDCGSTNLNYCDENNNCYESSLPDGVGTTYNLSDYTTSLSCSAVSNISIQHFCGNGSQNIFSFVGSSDSGNSGVCTGSFNFEIGKGGTIFSLYRNFYSGGDLKDVGTFINLWQLNYNQWFNVRNSDAVVFDNAEFYLADWNGPGTNVKVRYDNITFPFAGKPAVLFFMTDYIYSNTPEFQMGDEIVSYCYAKLNRDNIKNGSVSFDDYYNSIPGYVQGNISSYTNYSFKPSEGYSVPSSSGGESNMWNYVVSTGNSIPSDLDPTELFKGFYNRITSLVSSYNPYSNGIIPLRIVYPMIFLILFRILRH